MVALLVYVVLKGLESTVVRALQLQGARHPVDGINPISACNLFFFALVVVGTSLVLADRSTLQRQLPLLHRRQWQLLALDMLAGSLLGPLGSFMAIEALAVIEKTLVFSLVLPASALLSWLWLGEPLPRRFWLTTVVIGLGLGLASLGSGVPRGMDRLSGLAWGGVGVAGFSCSAVTARRLNRDGLGIGLTTGLPSLLAALLFLLIGLVLYGPGHFMHLQLWWVAGVIGLYAITVVLGSECSLRLCYRRFSVATVAIVGSLSLAVSVVSAAVVLAEPLRMPVLLGSGLVLLGVMLAVRAAPIAAASSAASSSGAATLRTDG
ncbi:EamA family transporter [Synechococcus sp. CS-1328]|uniref:EamA family transporter n=1 Tax=Synechococcus sp. CS-1328 TaxID=2847976 RepID=UPI0021E3960F|nr:EamA family transporter [Synechococcus sp. CS-1328]MCT0223885.1 EamA family transporter [Synechococcus sp. CS-1328]